MTEKAVSKLQTSLLANNPLSTGLRDALPILGGYFPVAVSFGLIATQAGFSVLAAVLVSTLIYSGAAQFLFVGMLASGAPLWLVVGMTLLINTRHLVYGPNLAQHLPQSRWWPYLMHGLTDEVFALAHNRLPKLSAQQRLGWFTGVMLLAWFSWIGGTAVGAFAGEELTARWPLMGEVLPFVLPALFVVLLAPRFSSRRWSIALYTTIVLAFVLKLAGLTNAAIPLAAIAGAILFEVMKSQRRAGGKQHD